MELFRKSLCILGLFTVLSVNSIISAHETKVEQIVGHVTSVLDDGKTVVVNRGENDNLIVDHLCFFLPNRGDGGAEIEWDIQLANGKIKKLTPDSVFITLQDIDGVVKFGDYCGLNAEIPVFVLGTDIGMIAAWDIGFIDYEFKLPIFELKELIRNPSQEKIDSIIDVLVEEVHKHADVAELGGGGRIIKGGIFDGMSWGEAFEKTRKEDVKLYLEYVRYFPARYINYYWEFISTYATWMSGETPTAEHERKKEEAAPHADEGDMFVAEGKYQDAIESFKKALATFPDYFYAEERLRFTEKVLKHIKMLEDDPNDVMVRYELGREYYELYKYDEALEQFYRAKELGYDSVAVNTYIGYSYTGKSMYSKAREIFESLAKIRPKDENIKKWLRYASAREKQYIVGGGAESYIMTGNIKYEEENFDAAITEYKRALELDPDSKKARRLIDKTTKRKKALQEQEWAWENWGKGDFDYAKYRWENAISICEKIDDIECVKANLDDMADYMFDHAFYDSAIVVYKRILEIDPKEYDPYISISNCYKGKKDYQRAVEWAEKGIKVSPSVAWGYNILGLAYQKMGIIDKQIAYFLKATELDTEYKWPNYNLALAYVKKGNYEKAKQYFERAIEIDNDFWDARNDLVNVECILETIQKLEDNPGDINSRLRLARAHWHIGEYERCIEELKKVIAERNNDVTALSYLGYSYTELGEFDEGKPYLEKAYSLQPIPNLKAWLLYNEGKKAISLNPKDTDGYLKLGESDLYWEYFNDALADFGLAQQMGADTELVYLNVTKARQGNEADKLYDNAGTYYSRAEYEKGIEYAEKALKLYRSIGDKSGEMWSLLRIGWCYAGLHQHKKALKYYEKTGIIADELFDEVKKAKYLAAIGDYYKSIGEYPTALEYKKEAQILYHNNNDLINEAWTLSSIGFLVGSLGEFDEMISSYKKALSIHEKTMNFPGICSALSDIGWAYENEGDYSMALEYQMKALKVAQDKNQRWTEMYAYSGIGSIYSELGDSLNAVKYRQYFLDAATALGSKTDRSNALNSLGLVYLEITGEYEKALEYFIKCRNLSRLIEYTVGEGCAISNIGVAYSRQGKHTEALAYHEKGLRLVRSVNSSYTEMQGLDEMGETYQELKRYTEALKCHLQAIEIAEAIGVKTEKWRYELNAGKVYEEMDNFEKAVEYYKRSAGTLSGIKKKIKSEKLRKGFAEMEKQIEVYKRLIDILIRMGKPDEAFKYIEESKSKIIKDAFGDIKPKTEDKELKLTLEEVDKIEKKKEALEKQLLEEKKKPVEEQDETKIMTLSKTLANTEGEFNQWMMRLKFQNPNMFDALTIKPATLGDVQNDIPGNILLLEYFISSDKLYIFCIGKNHFVAKSVDVAESEINGLVEYYLGVVKDPLSNVDEELNEPALKLYEYLLRPVEDEMEKFENIVIVPFGSLYYLPFHALVCEKKGKKEYFLNLKKVSYTTSATFADLLREEDKSIDKLIGMGNPDGSLPSASEEVELLRNEIFKQNALIWTLSEATKEKFLTHAKDYDIVHLATHGTILNNPLESYLLFAGDTENEQKLTLLEVAGYTALRDRTDLVFLSACQTATEEGKGGSGSELISLAEAFAMAGPPTLIATLWEVNDVSTSKLVVNFYHELKNRDENKLDALRSAQLDLLKSENFSHPYFWAPFILIGNWR
ncbi:tetratricopeptide repeat protein [candidate division WOR-3 bacterium]|nr:tetratricopeptide repeat protein [candidate division WOR-3 bacterium]